MNDSLDVLEFGQLKIYFGMGERRHSLLLQIAHQRINEWDLDDLLRLQSRPYYISGMEVAPRTVVELYSGPKFDGTKTTIVHGHFNGNYCVEFIGKYASLYGNVNSIRTWRYEYWWHIQNLPKCKSNADRASNHYCLCPTGAEHPELCPEEGRRCLHKSQAKLTLRELNSNDFVNVMCLKSRFNTDFDNIDSYGNVQDALANCICGDKHCTTTSTGQGYFEVLALKALNRDKYLDVKCLKNQLNELKPIDLHRVVQNQINKCTVDPTYYMENFESDNIEAFSNSSFLVNIIVILAIILFIYFLYRR